MQHEIAKIYVKQAILDAQAALANETGPVSIEVYPEAVREYVSAVISSARIRIEEESRHGGDDLSLGTSSRIARVAPADEIPRVPIEVYPEAVREYVSAVVSSARTRVIEEARDAVNVESHVFVQTFAEAERAAARRASSPVIETLEDSVCLAFAVASDGVAATVTQRLNELSIEPVDVSALIKSILK